MVNHQNHMHKYWLLDYHSSTHLYYGFPVLKVKASVDKGNNVPLTVFPCKKLALANVNHLE